MSALKEAGSVSPAPRISNLPPSDTWASHTAGSFTRWWPSGAVISVNGELDAANADEFAGHVQHCAMYCDWLVLDLTDLEFIGTTGFAALNNTNQRCADAGIRCTLVPGLAVARLLRICDPDHQLPTTTSVAGALAGLQGLRQVR